MIFGSLLIPSKEHNLLSVLLALTYDNLQTLYLLKVFFKFTKGIYDYLSPKVEQHLIEFINISTLKSTSFHSDEVFYYQKTNLRHSIVMDQIFLFLVYFYSLIAYSIIIINLSSFSNFCALFIFS